MDTQRSQTALFTADCSAGCYNFGAFLNAKPSRCLLTVADAVLSFDWLETKNFKKKTPERCFWSHLGNSGPQVSSENCLSSMWPPSYVVHGYDFYANESSGRPWLFPRSTPTALGLPASATATGVFAGSKGLAISNCSEPDKSSSFCPSSREQRSRPSDDGSDGHPSPLRINDTTDSVRGWNFKDGLSFGPSPHRIQLQIITFRVYCSSRICRYGSHVAYRTALFPVDCQFRVRHLNADDDPCTVGS